MKYQYDIAIIGGGSGGLVVASAAVSMGARVLLVESRKMGGDCLNYGCVPSKTFLKSAHLAQKIMKSDDYGLIGVKNKVDLKKIMNRVKEVIKEIAPHDSIERFTSLGVDVKIGKGIITDKNEISVNGVKFKVKKIVLATGSHATIPAIEGLNSVDYLTNETVFELEVLPKRLVVLGAGPIGLELGQGFAHLGSKVTIIDRSKTLFGKDEPETSKIMEKALLADNVNLMLDTNPDKVEKIGNEIVITTTTAGKTKKIACDYLLVALGRTPNTKNLGLQEVGVKIDKRGFIVVNNKLQTNIKNIFAVGDVKGKFLFTHAAGYEASVVVKNALIMPIFKIDYSNMPWTTYTVPEVAHVGCLESEAKEKGIFGSNYIIPISDNDRSKTEDDRAGFVKVILNKKGILIGASIVGDKAGEMLPILSLMVTKKMKLSALMSVIFQYPIQGEIFKSLALQQFKTNVKAWELSLLKFIVRR